MMISASIVLFNTSFDQLSRVTADFFSSPYARKLYLIDNSPHISEKIFSLVQQYGCIEYIFLDQNVGYGKGHNLGMQLSEKDGYEFHVVLNPDIRFDPAVIKGLCERMESDDSIAHIMPKICYSDSSTQYLCKLLPSPLDLFLRRFLPFSSLRFRLAYSYELRNFNYDTELRDVPALSGCFMFLRLKLIRDVGYFDENIFMYLEDVDLSRRILERYSNLYCPAFTVNHEYNMGSYKNTKLLGYHIRSAIYYFCKWGWFFDGFRRRTNQAFREKNIRSLVP